MRKFVMPVLIGLLAAATPSTYAAEVFDIVADCGFETVAQETLTGGQDTYTGVAYGYAIDTSGATVTVACEVRVDGSTADSTPTGTGSGLATTSDQVTFTATDAQDVKLCTVVNGASVVCNETTSTQVPPQAVIDAVDALFQLFADLTAPTDPLICGALLAAGVPAALNSVSSITMIWVDWDDCDVWTYCPYNRIIDFVPYEDPWNGPNFC